MPINTDIVVYMIIIKRRRLGPRLIIEPNCRSKESDYCRCQGKPLGDTKEIDILGLVTKSFTVALQLAEERSSTSPIPQVSRYDFPNDVSVNVG